MRHIIVEGIDRIGKDSLIRGLKDQLGFFQEVHFQKPELLKRYVKTANFAQPVTLNKKDAEQRALALYQYDSFRNMFLLLANEGNLILNRAHLGEAVYSQRYRGYDGNYVFDLEKQHPTHDHTLLVLLHTSDFSFIKDDGKSFDFSKKEEEQEDFKKAFSKSVIRNKIMIDVCNGKKKFKPAKEILQTVVTAFGREWQDE